MTLQDLAVKHDYYCHESNYYSNEAREIYASFEAFYSDWNDADVDMNLVFRWDVKQVDEDTVEAGYYAQIFIIQQRKGIFVPVVIEKIEENNVPLFLQFLKPHLEKLKKNWLPLV
jgi:hypothetical protein